MDRILPYPVILTAVVVAIAIFLLRRTQFGRHTYAIGGNMEAAIRTGIPVDRHVIKLYMLSASPPASPASSRRCASPPARR